MSAPTTGGAGAEGEDPAGPVIRDRRRLDPQTGQVRPTAQAQPPPADPGATDPGATDPGATDPGASAQPEPGQGAGAELADAAAELAAERLLDLQRLQAEYVNYRRRVERDRAVARDTAVASVLEALLPVLDDIELARQHGDLEGGPFAAIAEKLETVLTRFDLSRFGAAGEPFDPTVHEALMQSLSDEVEVATVTTVLQPGYMLKERVLRAARVGVTAPE